MAQINPTKIDVPFAELKKVIHVSDIHIRLYKRHREYREVFDTLYSQIQAKVTECESTIILVSGDILHAKTDLSPEMIALASEFLRRLAEITTTIVTVGNHDLNLANSYRLDSLSPIIENISNNNLYYLKDSGIYTIADTDFALFSIIGDRKDWPRAKQCKSAHKVALLHAPVNDAKTDTGFTITSRHADVSTFIGFDMVMLGDIHRHQVLQYYDSYEKEPIIVYAGSMIQQNHGELLEGHGLLEWNIPRRSFKFHKVPNRYGYATLIVENGKIPDISHIPEMARLRVFVKDLEPSKVKKIESILRKKFKLQEFIVNKLRDDQLTLDNRKCAAEFADIHDVAVQNKLIGEYLTRHFAIVDKELMSRIYDLNEELNSRVDAEDRSHNIYWKPLFFEFSNMFSYGEGNELDFDGMHGVIGLFSPNASGKTATFDALMFCLYDKTPRAYKASHIMNNRKKKFECCLRFEINGVEYGIKRVGIRKKNGDVKVDVQFWQEDAGKRISLNGEDRRTTNAIIRRYVGTYDDFILTSLSVQNNNSLFIDKSQSERKDLLSQFMGINIFDTLYQMALDEMKETRGALKRMSKEDHAEILAQTQIKIDGLQIDYKAFSKESNSIGEELSQVESKISTLYESKTPLDVSDLNITALEETKVNLATALSTLSEQIIGWDRKKKELRIESGSLSSRVQSLGGVTEKYGEMESARHELQAVEMELDGFMKLIESGQARLNHITSHEYDPNCEFCVKNNTSLVEQSDQISKDLGEMRQKTAELEPQKSTFEVLLIDYDEIATEYTLKQDTIQTLQMVERDLLIHTAKLSDLKSSITTKKSRLKDVNTKIRKYHRSIDRIEKNARIDGKIGTAEQLQQEFIAALKSLDTKLRGLHGKLQVEKASKRKVLKELSEMEDLEQEIQAYEFYVHAVKRDGVPYELVSKVIPSIQSEVNNILSQIAEFTIALEVDGKNINGRIVYGDDRHWPLEMSSGMERFISSLAIRVALITVSNLPKPNFLIIDEGLGTLSSENLMSMNLLFSILKNQFDFMIIISHLEAVRDMVDSLMEIQLENGFSKINY